MDDLVTTLGPIGMFTGWATVFVGWLIAGMTLAWPRRPSWVGFALNIGLGPLTVLVLAASFLPEDQPWTRQTWGRIVVAGILAGMAAAGKAWTQQSADEKRQEVKTEEAEIKAEDAHDVRAARRQGRGTVTGESYAGTTTDARSR